MDGQGRCDSWILLRHREKTAAGCSCKRSTTCVNINIACVDELYIACYTCFLQKRQAHHHEPIVWQGHDIDKGGFTWLITISNNLQSWYGLWGRGLVTWPNPSAWWNTLSTLRLLRAGAVEVHRYVEETYLVWLMCLSSWQWMFFFSGKKSEDPEPVGSMHAMYTQNGGFIVPHCDRRTWTAPCHDGMKAVNGFPKCWTARRVGGNWGWCHETKSTRTSQNRYSTLLRV